MLFYHVLINLFFNIIFCLGGWEGLVYYFLDSGWLGYLFFYLFVFFGMVGIWDSDLMELKGTCDWVPFEFLCVIF